MRLALVFAVAMHAAIAGFTGLTGDEAHYLLYARFLDWSYFDHPPLVGWLQAPIIALTDSVAVIRLLPQLIWVACAWLLYKITQELCSNETAPAWAVVLFCLSPILHIHGIALLPDTLLCLFALLAVWLSLRMGKWALAGGAWQMGKRPVQGASGGLASAGGGQPNIRHWALLGLVLGLAGLSKYSAVFLALGLGIYFLVVFGGRLPLIGVATMAAVGLLVVSPVFLWNAAHDWISFKYQGGHVSGGAWRPEMVLVFVVGQLLVFGPLTVWGLLRFWRGRRQALAHPKLVWLLGAFAVPVLFLAYLAGGGRSLPYWTSPAWVVALPFAAIGLAGMGGGEGGRKGGSRDAQRLRFAPIAAAMVALLQIALMLWVTASLVMGRPMGSGTGAFQAPNPSQGTSPSQTPNPFADVHGWDQLGRELVALSRETRISTLAIGNWTLASRLGWYARPLPVWVADSRFDQFDLWWPRPAPGELVLFVVWSGMPSAKGSGNLYNCETIREIPFHHLGRAISSFTVSRCLAATLARKQ